MTYYLQYSNKERRELIHTSIRRDCELLRTIDAGSWLEAKQSFGYPLTNRQLDILEMEVL